ncbi:HopJ type III effector protein [Sphingobacterium oryzagri]|uniref:HopJ type III effector protein n=1 Tax=Sphingobacterium oryzagri TaxID=3025669 RepID=A0ABY7WKS8_9SPHI|nr:HopJ type III effector protein [Sphingobacterium sp. KACC 22765]WDF70201.1 HopJ type III effector protein [Sphingobacterium sp. KACC 22765]
MQTQISDLLQKVKAGQALFSDVIVFIEEHYTHQPTAFKNGETYNEASQNQGSAKVFAFAQQHALSKEDTLHLFAEHYQAVLASPAATDHQNIRQFIANGWDGISFEGAALTAKH